MASRGVQCQLVEEALFALVQIGPRDGADSLSARSLQRLRADMQPQTVQLYDSLARGLRGSDAYENGAQAYSAAVGRYVDRALRACAGAWFADADADRVNACAKANLAGTAIANARRRGIAAAEALQIAQKAAPVGAPSAREMVEHFYRFPSAPTSRRKGRPASWVARKSCASMGRGNRPRAASRQEGTPPCHAATVPITT
jgi:hypothetical protein